MTPIETERLLLRRWRRSDSAPFHEMNSDPAVVKFLLKPLSLDESNALIVRIENHFDQHGYGSWAVEEKATGCLIGFTGLVSPSFETHFSPCVEIGWRFAKASWGKGYATEAARAALEFGFGPAGLSEIVSFTSPANVKSIAVMERLGMKRDFSGDFEHPRVPVGHPLRPHVLYRISSPT
jgi:ribosomal-protein-alanine N-acetyltransferase